jgi:hypothetical protein
VKSDYTIKKIFYFIQIEMSKMIYISFAIFFSFVIMQRNMNERKKKLYEKRVDLTLKHFNLSLIFVKDVFMLSHSTNREKIL